MSSEVIPQTARFAREPVVRRRHRLRIMGFRPANFQCSHARYRRVVVGVRRYTSRRPQAECCATPVHDHLRQRCYRFVQTCRVNHDGRVVRSRSATECAWCTPLVGKEISRVLFLRCSQRVVRENPTAPSGLQAKAARVLLAVVASHATAAQRVLQSPWTAGHRLSTLAARSVRCPDGVRREPAPQSPVTAIGVRGDAGEWTSTRGTSQPCESLHRDPA